MSEIEARSGRGESGIVDVGKRRQLASEVLDDPTIFPSTFPTWIKRMMEASGATWPASSIIGLKPRLVAIAALQRDHAALRDRVEALEQQMSSRQGDRL